MKKLIFIQTAVPGYRKNFFQYLSGKLKNKFELFAGMEYFEASITSDKNIHFVPVNNHFFVRRKLLFQTGIWHLLFSDAVIVMEMNPRIMNNWIFLILRKLFGKKNVLWGHAWPRKGRKKPSEFVRNLMRKMADEIIVYTRQQQLELQQKMPEKKIKAAPNALYLKNMIHPVENTGSKDLIFVGRLAPQKKVTLLVHAFYQVLKEIPGDINLQIVGDGEELDEIETFIQKNDLKNRIKLHGQISDYPTLKTLYSQAFFSIIPGETSLSIIQSLSFGVPLLIAGNVVKSPEFEAVIEGENTVFFDMDDAEDLAKILNNIYNKQKYWIAKRKEISVFCQKNYSVETMAKPFLELI